MMSDFKVDEFLETLLRMKLDQPRRYARNISAGTKRRVDQYEQARAELDETHTVQRRAA
jgi:nitroimidazol reductase NimA-like FMN-containing flavoprotein (pyridoxamine 5'-phosphate oxidase superfamily)